MSHWHRRSLLHLEELYQQEVNCSASSDLSHDDCRRDKACVTGVISEEALNKWNEQRWRHHERSHTSKGTGVIYVSIFDTPADSVRTWTIHFCFILHLISLPAYEIIWEENLWLQRNGVLCPPPLRNKCHSHILLLFWGLTESSQPWQQSVSHSWMPTAG